MSFSEAVATLPDAIRLWVLWLTIVMILAPVLMLAWRGSRQAGLVIAAANIAVAISMQALYASIGFVRLLGLPHVVFWTPLAVWLIVRLRRDRWPGVPLVAALVFLASILVSLVFDYADVVRWLAGERAPMAEATAR